MVKTFEKIINEEYNKKENYYVTSGDLNDIKDFCIKLMKLVREKTLIEVANVAEADYNIINSDDRDESIINGEIEVYVLKESILQLDKNSIEL